MVELVCEATAFGDFARGEIFVLDGVALLQNACNLEAAPAKNFLERTDGPCGLLEQDVERPWGRAGDDEDCLFAFEKRNRVAAFAVVHHAVNPAVKKHFELPRHVAPVARRAYD